MRMYKIAGKIKKSKATKLGIIFAIFTVMILAMSSIAFAPLDRGSAGGGLQAPNEACFWGRVTFKEDDQSVTKPGVFSQSEWNSFMADHPEAAMADKITVTTQQYNFYKTHIPGSSSVAEGNLVLNTQGGSRTINGNGVTILDQSQYGKDIYKRTFDPATGRSTATFNSNSVPASADIHLATSGANGGEIVWDKETVFGTTSQYVLRPNAQGGWDAYPNRDAAQDPSKVSYRLSTTPNGNFLRIGYLDGDVRFQSPDGKTDIDLDRDEYQHLSSGGHVDDNNIPALVNSLRAVGIDPETAIMGAGNSFYDGATPESSRNSVSFDSSTGVSTHIESPRGFDKNGNPNPSPAGSPDLVTRTATDPATGRIKSFSGGGYSSEWDYTTNTMKLTAGGKTTPFSVIDYGGDTAYSYTPPGENQPTYIRVNDGRGTWLRKNPDGTTVAEEPPDSVLDDKTKEAMDDAVIDPERKLQGSRSEANIWAWDNILGATGIDTLLAKLTQNKYQGFGGYFSFSYEEKWMKQWRDNVHRTFCDTIVLGGIDCWTSKLCEVTPDTPGEDAIFVASPGGGLAASATLSFERTASPTVVPQPDGSTETFYLYKTEYYLVNSHPFIERPMQYNLHFVKESGGEIDWFDSRDPDRIIQSGSYGGARGVGALVAYSKTKYSRVCMKWNVPLRSVSGKEFTHICTNLKVAEGAPTEYYDPSSPTGVDPDTDGDGLTDSVDDDDDNDGILDVSDDDGDNDGIDDDADNCPSNSNAGQEDADNDGTGDACDIKAPGADF